MTAMEHLDVRSAEYFLALAEEGHFTRSAARLHIAQSSLSAAVRRLEAQLGVELFRRTSRRVVLTPAGEALVPYAKQLLVDSAEAVGAVRAAAKIASQSLVVGVTRSAQPVALAFISALWERQPDVHIDLCLDFAAGLERRLLDGEIDVAVSLCPARNSALRCERMADLPSFCAVHHQHRLATRDSVGMDELKDETFVLAPQWMAPGQNEAILGLCKEAGFEPKTATGVGFRPPEGVKPEDAVGFTTEMALDGVPLPYEIRQIPLLGVTLPVDLVFLPGCETKANSDVAAIARRIHKHGWEKCHVRAAEATSTLE